MKSVDSKRLLCTNRVELRKVQYGTLISFDYNGENICGRLVDCSTNDNFTVAQMVVRGDRSINEKITYKFHLAKNLKTKLEE